MIEFAYNNSKNANISYLSLELNYGYHFQVSFKDKYNICSRFSSTNKLATKLKKLMNIYYQNLFYAQNLQKQANDKGVKPQSYILGEKI